MTDNGDIKVVKSDGSRVDIDLDKIHIMVSAACKNITGISESLVEMNSGLQFYDGITTKDIQSILVKSTSDLISLQSPNYQFVAADFCCLHCRNKYLEPSGKTVKTYILDSMI